MRVLLSASVRLTDTATHTAMLQAVDGDTFALGSSLCTCYIAYILYMAQTVNAHAAWQLTKITQSNY